jgi:hypothetical protein
LIRSISRVRGLIGSCARSRESPAPQIINRDLSRPERQDDQHGKQEKKRRGGSKLVRIAEDRLQRIALRGCIGHTQSEHQRHRGSPREKPDHQQEAAEALGATGQRRIQFGQRDIQTAEVFGRAIEVQQLALAGQEKIPAPIEPEGQQERALQPGGDFLEFLVDGLKAHGK